MLYKVMQIIYGAYMYIVYNAQFGTYPNYLVFNPNNEKAMRSKVTTDTIKKVQKQMRNIKNVCITNVAVLLL